MPNLNFADIWADGKEMSFSDLLDIINPLRQLPIVSTIYHAITGDPSPLAGAPSARPIRRPRRRRAGRGTTIDDSA